MPKAMDEGIGAHGALVARRRFNAGLSPAVASCVEEARSV
jgi:hypothetical protein